MVVVGNRSPTPTYIHAVILPSHLFPPPGSKPHSNLAQRCSGKGPQLHWWHKTISFPCFIHKMGAKQDAQSPLHPCVPSSHEHTLIPSPATCLAQPTHLQKPWCRPFVLTHAKCTPIAKPSPVRFVHLWLGWPVGELPMMVGLGGTRGEGVAKIGLVGVQTFQFLEAGSSASSCWSREGQKHFL